MFNYYFTTKNTGSIEWGLGIGSSFRGMFGKVVGFGYDSLLGITAQGSLFFKRLVASFKISPIGNSFNFNASNIESQLHIGFRLVDNSYSRDYILYFQANKLKYNPTNILLIDSTSYMAGVSLGF